MRRALPRRELIFLSKWYEDYLLHKYGQPKPVDDEPTDDERIGDAPWAADSIAGGKT